MFGLTKRERTLARGDAAYRDWLVSERARRAERAADEADERRERAYSGWLVLAATESERAAIRAELAAIRARRERAGE